MSELCSDAFSFATNLVVFDLRSNFFQHDFSILWHCIPPPLDNLQQLYLGNNSFSSTEVFIDFSLLPSISILDLSDNLLGGVLTLTNFEFSNAIFNATGNFFTCPMPLKTASQLAFFSPCFPNYHDIYRYLEILSYVAAPCLCIFLCIFVNRWYSSPQFTALSSWLLPLAWLFACISLFADIQLLWGMQAYVLSQVPNCMRVNQRAVFFSFMPFSDILANSFESLPNICANYTIYYNPAGPDSPIDSKIPNTIAQQCFLFGLPFSLSPPPPTQTFLNFSLSLQEWKQHGLLQGTFELNDNYLVFAELCENFPSCIVVTVDGVPVCTDPPNTAQWSSKSHYHFLIIVVLVLAYKIAIEIGKLSVIFISIWHRQVWHSSWTIGFIQNSPFLLLLPLAGINPWRDVLGASLHAKDWGCLFVYDGLLYRAPTLGLTFWWFNSVTQQGLQPLNYFSLLSGMLSMLVILARALHAVRKARKSFEINLLRNLVPTNPILDENFSEELVHLSYIALEEVPS